MSQEKTTNLVESRRGGTIALLASLVLHVSLLLLLACWFVAAGRPSRGLLLEAELGQFDSTDLTDTFELSADAADKIAVEDPLETPVLPEQRLSLDINLDNVLAQPADETAGSQLAATLSALSTTQVADSLSLQGQKRGASFFGSYAHGERFVYVLDSSRSMRGDRWTYACSQLIDSLNGLKSGQEFFVICFDLETTFLFNVTPDRATYAEIDDSIVLRVKRWLRSRSLGRATMPADALRYALEFDPDAIFLLSDGELQDNSLMMLRLLNNTEVRSRQVPVHTVHLFSEEGRRTLQQIAMDNGGSFTPVRDR